MLMQTLLANSLIVALAIVAVTCQYPMATEEEEEATPSPNALNQVPTSGEVSGEVEEGEVHGSEVNGIVLGLMGMTSHGGEGHVSEHDDFDSQFHHAQDIDASTTAPPTSTPTTPTTTTTPPTTPTTPTTTTPTTTTFAPPTTIATTTASVVTTPGASTEGALSTPEGVLQTTPAAGTSEPYGECAEPPEHQLHMSFKRTNRHLKFPALAILPAEEESERQRAPLGHHSNEYVNTTCPSELLHVSGITALSGRSLCPWTYVSDVDPLRYPSTIQIATCRCERCIETSLPTGGAFSTENNCHQVMFTMTVLRRGECVDGMYIYHRVYQEVPVACACIRPKQ